MRTKKFYSSLLMAALTVGTLWGADYGLPSGIQDGNILHCFNWPAKEVKNALPQIAAAGFGSVQLSPLQRGDVSASGSSWHDLYRPYDLAFKTSGFCSEQDLKDLCAAADEYGIKVIVDVVANHVDKTKGYHDTWWDSNGRVRWEGTINYGNRYSITHGQLGDYGDVNSESAEVQARAKAYVEFLKGCGVKGIRWDAAKHIGLPSEGCDFWSTVTSVSGIYHYGEILNDDSTPVNEYAKYMSITDNRYSNGAAKDNGGLQQGYGGAWAVDKGVASTKLVYWAESHDTYANDEWSQNVDQSVIDRAYACVATRNGATALYLSRPNTKGFSNIKTGKGSTAFTSSHIAAVNKLRNAAGSAADYCKNEGNTFTVTRQGIGAVIVSKGSGNVSVTNGGGYCPTGSYKDLVSGSTFTVTATTISGSVGSSGIAVIIKDGVAPVDPVDPVDPTPTPTGDMWILGNLSGTAGWSTTPGTGAAMTLSNSKYTAQNVTFVAASGETTSYFNITDYVGSTWDDLNMNANRYGAATEGAPITVGTPANVVKYTNNVDASACKSWTVAPGTYDITFDPSAMTITVSSAGDTPVDPTPTPTPGDDPAAINGVYLKNTSNWSNPTVWVWNDSENFTGGKWPGQAMTKSGDYWKWENTKSGTPTQIIFSNDGNSKTVELTYVKSGIYDCSGTLIGTATGGGDTPTPTPGDYTIYFDNSNGWATTPKAYAWNSSKQPIDGNWPGRDMTLSSGTTWTISFSAEPTGGIIILDGKGDKDANKAGGKDLTFVNGATYKSDGTYTTGPVVEKPVISISPDGGTFTESVTVNVSATLSATIYYSTSGTATTASTKYTSALTFTETTTLSVLAVASNGEQATKSATFTKSSTPTPGPTPTPGTGTNLINDYYKVNPNGCVGSNKTMQITSTNTGDKANISQWTSAELIAQGVARDVCQAFKGVHERPIIDAYGIFAAWDNDNLYLGLQTVYTVWDEGGEKYQAGESKPYNMDGKLCWAFNLGTGTNTDGTVVSGGSIWQDGKVFTTFNNNTDCIWFGSTKPGVGNPGLFFGNGSGQSDYNDDRVAKGPNVKYSYASGLNSTFNGQIWGPKAFGNDLSAERFENGTDFSDLSAEVTRMGGDESGHTFYEFKFPLADLGITKQYIENYGIGVMFVSFYGSSAHESLPYDPSFYDNVFESYSADPSSSKEKEDQDVVTYSHARVGKLASSSIADITVMPESTGVSVSGNAVTVNGGSVIIAGIDGKVYYQGVVDGAKTFELGAGAYIVNVNGRGTRVLVK